MAKRVCVVTAGHLSTTPRMLKAADSLAAAGYDVRVVSTRFVHWATQADTDVRQTRTWDWSVVDYDRYSARATYVRSGIRQRLARWLAKRVGPHELPLVIAAWAYSRVHSELVRAALAEPADFYYGGTNGALAAVAAAARTAQRPFALDLEDFHSGEHGPARATNLDDALAVRIEESILARARFLTASSEDIGAAYRHAYSVHPIILHNTFPLPDVEPALLGARCGARPRLYWFSQTIGPGRGLEDAVAALGLLGVPAELHLRGRAISSYRDQLIADAYTRAPRLSMHFLDPAPPDDMVALASGHDVGLALEQPDILNHRIALSNKAFVYLLAGLATVFTDTPAQRRLAEDLGPAALVYPAGDAAALARGLERWFANPDVLLDARREAWSSAKRRWNWGHTEESGALLRAVRRVVG